MSASLHREGRERRRPVPPIGLTRASELIQSTDTLERLGESPERILEQAKLPMWHRCDPNHLIPRHHIGELMDQAARSLGCSTFGLLVATENRLATMGAYGALVVNSPTTHRALTTGSSLIHLHNSGSKLWLAEAGDETWFAHREVHGPERGRRQLEQYVLMRMIDHVTTGAGPSWRPAKVCLQTPEAPDRWLREVLCDPEIRLGQKFTGIAVPRAILAQPLHSSDTAEGGAHHDDEAVLGAAAPALDFVGSLRQVVGTLLSEGPPQIETMAEVTGLSVRSLQRRLADAMVTYSDIVGEARYEAAVRLLEDPDNSITDIGLDLGYADSAHFTRAFKRWAGVTPREYRLHQQVR